MNSGKVLLGILAGVAAGALAGILLAPDKGKNTRKRIVKKGEDYVDSLKGKFNELLDDISVKLDDVKEEVSDLTEKTRAKTTETKKEPKTAKE